MQQVINLWAEILSIELLSETSNILEKIDQSSSNIQNLS
jgi:outer membrane murein-binding lipoprotein Lpp